MLWVAMVDPAILMFAVTGTTTETHSARAGLRENSQYCLTVVAAGCSAGCLVAGLCGDSGCPRSQEVVCPNWRLAGFLVDS